LVDIQFVTMLSFMPPAVLGDVFGVGFGDG